MPANIAVTAYQTAGIWIAQLELPNGESKLIAGFPTLEELRGELSERLRDVVADELSDDQLEALLDDGLLSDGGSARIKLTIEIEEPSAAPAA